MASLRGEVKPVRERGDRVNGAHFRTVSPQRHSCCCTWLYRWKVTEVPVWRMKRRRFIETFKSLSTFHTWPIDARSGCVCVCVCVCVRLSVANIVRSTPILMSENCGPKGVSYTLTAQVLCLKHTDNLTLQSHVGNDRMMSSVVLPELQLQFGLPNSSVLSWSGHHYCGSPSNYPSCF